jgi:hypothetical protein
MLPGRLLAIGFLLLAPACAPLAQAQPPAPDPRNFDATQFGERVPLGPNWLFAPGDNPAYAAPTYDDSAWMTVSTAKELVSYGIRDIPFAWYRLHIHLRPGTRNLMVGTVYMHGKYEIYANGVRVGGNGPMTRPLFLQQDALLTFPIPDNLLAPRGDLVLAIRFALDRAAQDGLGKSTPLYSNCVHLLSSDSAPREAGYVAAHRGAPALLACGLALIVCLISFALYSALRTNYEYLAVAIQLLAAGFSAALVAWQRMQSTTFPAYLALFVFVGIENFALIEFVRLILHLPRTRWLLALEIVSSLAFLLDATEILGIFPSYVYLVGFFAPLLTVKVLLPVMLIGGWLRGNREALLLLPAILLGSFADYWNFIRNAVYILRLTAIYPYLPFNVSVGTYQVDFWRLGDFAFYIAVLLFLIHRTLRIAQERALAAAELEAARTVQHVLIPEEIPTVPGFLLQSTYKPAGEVGGDFFQFLPVRGGSVLVVIGDVSGKGMPAAMTVSLLVGTVRTLAHFTQSPGEILAAMNQRMLARSSGGFTTCLVLRADPGGKLTIANAGHLAPYLAGDELPLDNGLPLGLEPEISYPESTFQLAPGQQLTLLSDGVVEARDKSGKLFGFERTADLAGQSADQIAKTAELFGQQDDITTLTLALAV